MSEVDLAGLLRGAAEEGKGYTEMVGLLREAIRPREFTAFDGVFHFKNAFGLSLKDAKDLTGAACYGNDVYTDEEADEKFRALLGL